MADKRRYVSREPRNPRTIRTMDEDTTGNPALDGFTVRHREGRPPERNRYFERPTRTKGLMDESEASWRNATPLSIYDED